MNDKSLPELAQDTIARMEENVFAEIAEEPRSDSVSATTGRTRRRGWTTALGVAAAFLVGFVVAPPLLTVLGAGAGGTTASGSSVADDGAESQTLDGAADSAGNAAESSGAVAEAESADRDIITSATASLRVTDVSAAIDTITQIAADKGGFVDYSSVAALSASDPSSPSDGYSTISIRVPADALSAVIDSLGDIGEVLSTSRSAQDVTATKIDLQARVDATRASVQRLTELMSQTTSVSELIEAETALSERQAQLESYEQQLADLQNQVSMSSLQVDLSQGQSIADPKPAGFGDGLLGGWNAFIAALNGLVVVIGFLLPWLLIAGVIALIVRLIVRARRRHLTTPPRRGINDPSE